MDKYIQQSETRQSRRDVHEGFCGFTAARNITNDV
jgi:hypothetical protein